MANPLIPGISATEQDLLYKKLSIYNQKKASFKEAGAYLVVLPRTDYPRYSLWVYSPLPERQSIFYIFDLNDEDLAAMHVFAKRVALAIGKAFPCRKVGEAVLGLEVPHAHIHLIPMQNEKDMLFSNPKLKLTDEEFKAVAEAIRAVL